MLLAREVVVQGHMPDSSHILISNFSTEAWEKPRLSLFDASSICNKLCESFGGS